MWSTSARTKHVLGSFRAGGAVTGASSVEETRGGSSTAASLPQGDAHRALIRPRTSTAAAAAHAESVRTLSAVWKDLDSSFLSLLSSYWSGQQHLLLPASSHQEKRFYLGPPPLLTSSFSFLPAYRKDTSWCWLFKKIYFLTQFINVPACVGYLLTGMVSASCTASGVHESVSTEQRNSRVCNSQDSWRHHAPPPGCTTRKKGRVTTKIIIIKKFNYNLTWFQYILFK